MTIGNSNDNFNMEFGSLEVTLLTNGIALAREYVNYFGTDI